MGIERGGERMVEREVERKGRGGGVIQNDRYIDTER